MIILWFGAFTCLLVMVAPLPLQDTQGNGEKIKLTYSQSGMTTTNGVQMANQQSAYDKEIVFPTNNSQQSVDSEVVAPRTNGPSKRQGRSKKNYFVIAVAPMSKYEKSTIPYDKLYYVPMERAIDNDEKEENEEEPVIAENAAEESEDERYISMHKMNKYFRRLMRRLRKGTRKFMHQTFFRSAESRPKESRGSKRTLNGFYFKEGVALKPLET